MSLLEDFRALRAVVDALSDQVDRNKEILARHEEQISGKHGQSAVIDSLVLEVKSLRKAAYWVAGVIVAGAVTFAFSVLTLFAP